MATRWFLGALLSVLPTLAVAAGAAPPIPDTPAGHALDSWLTVFNNGDRAGIEGFVRSRASWLNLDAHMTWRAQTGGYDLLAIFSSDPTDVVFLLKARATPGEEIGRVTVSATNPTQITELGTFFFPAGATFIGFRVDDATRRKVVDTSIAKMTDLYVFPDVGKKMAQQLAKREKEGAYRGKDGETLAKLLTADLQGISHDKHLRVNFRPFELPPLPQAVVGHPQPEPIDCHFVKAERLPKNIGYLKIDGFVNSDECVQQAIGAMAFLAHVDALIFDMRDNGGGGGGAGGLLLSYLFDTPTRLSDYYDRRTGQTEHGWTSANVPGTRLASIPVYVLISHATFSMGEWFTFQLQRSKRATVVGEVSAGGAHTTETEVIDDRFSIRVPFGRPFDPVTNTDWEGVGIAPDVKVPAADAMAAAVKLATEALRQREH
ncbi:MAG TPA: S41 family peptidase [Steroidobacteraceae bacterium]|nr:S41 family peptidase [Steroidobacteraceae bacterium]